MHPRAAVSAMKSEMESDKNLIYFSTFILSFLESEKQELFYVLCFNVSNIVVRCFFYQSKSSAAALAERSDNLNCT